MKVLVTGANSFLATNTLIELLKRNYLVKAMLRKKSKIQLSDPNIEVCEGDITDKNAVSNAVKGCDIVIHIAANTSQGDVDYPKYEKVNVGGTINVFQAANKHKVKRVIYVSTANTFAYGTMQSPGDETHKIAYPFSKSYYASSKFEAQQYILQHLKEINPEVLIVNPTFMLGKHDNKPSSGEIILRGYRKKFILIPPGGKNFIHVKDVADAICNAIHKGDSGNCYILSNQNMSYQSFYKNMIAYTNQKSQVIIVPRFILLFSGSIGSLLNKLGIATDVHYTNMKMLCVENYFSNKKAISVLGLKTTPISKAIKDGVDWFIEEGMVNR